jgi:hypothetical protein
VRVGTKKRWLLMEGGYRSHKRKSGSAKGLGLERQIPYQKRLETEPGLKPCVFVLGASSLSLAQNWASRAAAPPGGRRACRRLAGPLTPCVENAPGVPGATRESAGDAPCQTTPSGRTVMLCRPCSSRRTPTGTSGTSARHRMTPCRRWQHSGGRDWGRGQGQGSALAVEEQVRCRRYT